MEKLKVFLCSLFGLTLVLVFAGQSLASKIATVDADLEKISARIKNADTQMLNEI
jgi:hypothetical protein